MMRIAKQLPGRAIVDSQNRFDHVMALSLDPSTDYKSGLIRCVIDRKGRVDREGCVDRSKLYKVREVEQNRFEIGEKLIIKGEEEMIGQIGKEGGDFLGLEDPDIWWDEVAKIIHVYFTLPFRNERTLIHLGHASGKSLDQLVMTRPVIMDDKRHINGGAKEVAIAPINRQGVRLNLVESTVREGGVRYSVVRVARAKDMGKEWQLGKIMLHPEESGRNWIASNASPGPLMSREFVDVGKDRRVGFMNGTEADKIVEGKTFYGKFRVGLVVYNFETGEIEWLSPEPVIEDSEAKNITFASQFVEKEEGKGILYAHADDSWVRGYEIEAEEIKKTVGG